MFDDRDGGRNSPLCKVSPHTNPASIADGLVEVSLNLDNTEVLQSLFDGAGLTRLRAVSGTKNCCAVLMARPTEVSPWLHDGD